MDVERLAAVDLRSDQLAVLRVDAGIHGRGERSVVAESNDDNVRCLVPVGRELDAVDPGHADRFVTRERVLDLALLEDDLHLVHRLATSEEASVVPPAELGPEHAGNAIRCEHLVANPLLRNRLRSQDGLAHARHAERGRVPDVHLEPLRGAKRLRGLSRSELDARHTSDTR